jgi:hypothetical protein
MARMTGKARPPQCPICRRESGIDCIGKGLAKRQVKVAERREWMAEAREELAQERDAEEEAWRQEAYEFYVRTHWAMKILMAETVGIEPTQV